MKIGDGAFECWCGRRHDGFFSSHFCSASCREVYRLRRLFGWFVPKL